MLPGGVFQQAKLEGVEGQDGVAGKEAAVEVEEPFAEHQRNAAAGAGVHFAEELPHDFREAFAAGRQGFQEFGEAAFGQQLNVFGEHAEEAAGEELGHHVRLVTGTSDLLTSGGARRHAGGGVAGPALLGNQPTECRVGLAKKV
jgi:hypothetical protein